jgi:hypothetical protein
MNTATNVVATSRPRLAAVTRLRTASLVLVVALGTFIVALYPRWINTGGYLTTDEGNWMGRTALFTRALVDGDPWGTYQSGHPGVMTMWLSLIGMGPERALALVEYVRPDGLEKAPNYLETLRLARRPFAVLTAAATVIVALLAWRLFGAGPAMLTAVLLGLDPFFLAHSVVAHVDSNVTTWITTCILAALIYFWAGGGRWYLALSGAAAGLAFLSKAPSAFLPLFIPLVALGALVARRAIAKPKAWLGLAIAGLTWGMLALVVAMTLWPSFRGDPIGTLREMVDYTEAVGGSDHENFFFGQPVGDPGPIYYLVCLGFRLSPVSMLGLLLLIVVPLVRRRLLPPGGAIRIAYLVAFCVLFVGMMSLAPKKFDRYLLPIFPVLQILAAVGFWITLRWLLSQRLNRVMPAVLVVIGALQVLPAAIVYPYYLAYYNPLLGGGPAARRSIVVGWGEGLDLVMQHLNTKSDAERLTVAGFYPRVMAAQFKGSILSPKQYDEAMADYIVLYVNAMQRDLADRLRTVTRGKRTEMVVRINGIEYARLFPIPPPPRRNAAGTEFGDGLIRLERSFLRSIERRFLKSPDLNPGDTIILTVRWQLVRPIGEDLVAVLEMRDRRTGSLVGESSVPVGASGQRTSALRAREVAIEEHRIELPDRAENYDLALGVRRADGTWLAVSAWPERLSAEARRGPNHVVVESIDVQ